MEKKKLLHIIVVTVLLLPVALSVIALTCSSEEIAAFQLAVLGFYFSGGPTDYRISLGGTFDLSSWANPISGGEEITDATITSTNKTAMSSITYTYHAPSGGDMGYFGGFLSSYVAGDILSAEIEANSHVLNGTDTQIPDSSASITSSSGSQTQPYNLTWTITPGSYSASHTMIWFYNLSGSVDSWHVVPVSQLSYQIDGFPLGSYFINVYPVNRMAFTNQGSTFEGEAYVGSTAGPSLSLSINF